MRNVFQDITEIFQRLCKILGSVLVSNITKLSNNICKLKKRNPYEINIQHSVAFELAD